MRQIINNDHIFKFPVFNNSEVLNEKSDFCFHAVFPDQDPGDVFSLGVDEINDFGGVQQGRGRENVDFVESRDFLQEL